MNSIDLAQVIGCAIAEAFDIGTAEMPFALQLSERFVEA